MKWFLIVTATVAALLALAWIVGMLLPEEHTARVGARVPGSPDDVWKAMTAPEDFPAWRPGVEEVEVLEPASDGPLRWTERTRSGSLTLEVVEREPPERLVVRIVETELPFGGSWTYELEPSDGGTRVRITEDGKVYNPIFRFVARFALGYEATMRDYLDGLAGRMAGGGEEEEGAAGGR